MNKEQLILLTARTLIADKKNWVQETISANKNGEHCPVLSPEARKFCAVGALSFVNGGTITHCDKAHGFLLKAVDEMTNTKDVYTVADFNDDNTHKKVLQMFDRAIELAGEK